MSVGYVWGMRGCRYESSAVALPRLGKWEIERGGSQAREREVKGLLYVIPESLLARFSVF